MTEQTENSTEKPESVRDSVAAAAAAAEMEVETPETPLEAQETPPEEAPEAEAPVETPEETPEAPEAPAVPDWWDNGRSGLWSDLSHEVQSYLNDTFAAREKAHTEAIEKDRIPDTMRTALRQVEDVSAGYGLTTEQGIQRLVQAQRMLAANPKHALAQLARDYGVDLSQFAAQEGETQQADPLQEMDNRVAAVVQQQLGAFQQQQAEAQTQKTLHDLKEWAEEKDDQGNLLRPHFDELQHLVKAEMDALLVQNPNMGWAALDKAYENVAALRAPAQDDLIAQRVEEALQKRAQEAAKAQNAAVSPKAGGSGTAPVTSGSKGSVIDDVHAAAADLASSARI